MKSQKSASRRLLSSALSFLLISSFLFISLMAFAGMNKSAAWFASVKEVTGEGMSVSVEAPESYISEVEYFTIERITLSEGKNNYHFDMNAPAPSGTLGTYSALSGERQLLVKITLPDSVDRVSLIAQSASQRYPVYNGAKITKDTPVGLSSVVKIHVLDGNHIDETDGEYVVYGSDLDDPKSFATVSSDGNSVTYSQNIDLYSTPNGNNDNELYIFIDYDEESMDLLLNYVNNLIMSGLTDYVSGDVVSFVGDFVIHVDSASE